VNCTDGRYVCVRPSVSPEIEPLYNYTIMPTHMRTRFSANELHDTQLVCPFAFTKGCPVLRIKARSWVNPYSFGTLLFDLAQDPEHHHPVVNCAVEERMIGHMVRLMEENDAPPEQYQRLGLAA